jgi:hypothetical protein
VSGEVVSIAQPPRGGQPLQATKKNRWTRVYYVRKKRLHIWLQTDISIQCTLHEIREIQEHDGCSSSVSFTICSLKTDRKCGYDD